MDDDKLQQVGNELFEHGRWEEAANAYRLALQVDPEEFWSRYHLGLSLSELRRWEEAATAYRQAIQVDAEEFRAHYHLGQALLALKCWEQAATAYGQAIQIDPEKFWSHNDLGRALSELKRWEEAAASYRQAIQIDPEECWSHQYLGQALSKLERWEDAATAYRQAIQLKPDWYLPHCNLANVLEHLEQWQAAITHYKKGIEIDPDNPECLEHLGRLLLSLDRQEEAAQVYGQLIRLTSSPQLLMALGEVLNQTGKTGQTDFEIPAYCKAIELAPSVALGYNRLGALLEKLERFDEALMFYEQAIANNAADDETHKRLESLRKRGPTTAGVKIAAWRRGPFKLKELLRRSIAFLRDF